MALTPTQTIFGKIAAILGMLQGLAWTCMSLACIIVYRSEKQIGTTSTSYSTLLNSMFYMYYLSKTPNTGQLSAVIRPKDFEIFMWFYFFFSVALLTASIDLFIAIRQNKNRQSKLMVLWGIVTGCTSVIDIIFASLLLRDFANCPNQSTTFNVVDNCHTAIGIPMTLAARGFVLWAVNIFLTYMLIAGGIQIITHVRVKNAIQDISIPRPKVQQAPLKPVYASYPSETSLEQPQMYQNGRNDYPSFIQSGNRINY
ncbi:unnamed protein product [Psylliodes chrysocephalus]|uniref:Uncharacterized protein n=1 Tax=Psylliodes chrysocephalus TaxID=3402493 RepID=A0A9P0G8V0_9CUCU|nr:unnamed protein product [Psylliodes chrysocephala]